MMSFKPLSKFYFTILLTSISFFGLAQTKEKDPLNKRCLLYTSDAADERSSVDLGGRRIIKKKNNKNT